MTPHDDAERMDGSGQELDSDELECQQAIELPDREEMSVITSPGMSPPVVIGPEAGPVVNP